MRDGPNLPEQRLERALLQFFPPAFAGFVSADITVLSRRNSCERRSGRHFLNA